MKHTLLFFILIFSTACFNQGKNSPPSSLKQDSTATADCEDAVKVQEQLEKQTSTKEISFENNDAGCVVEE